MRTITANVYTINEHPNKKACFEWIRNHWHDLGNYHVEEMVDSLKALAKAVGGKLEYSLSVVPDRREFCTIKDYDAKKLLELVKNADECLLTGVCYDFDVIEGLSDGNLEHTVLTTLHNEGEYLYGDTGLQELCEANGYEFTETGEAV